MGDEHVLAIDLGTSGLKTALVTMGGEVVADDFAEIGSRHLPGGGAEQDPGDWWTAITGAVHRLIEAGSVPAEDVAAIGITGQWASTLAVGGDGKALGPCILWMDSRGGPYTDDVIGGWPRLEGYSARKLWRWVRKSGAVPGRAGDDPIGHLLFLRHERPDEYRAAATFFEPLDYVAFCLTGRRVGSRATMGAWWLTDNRDLSGTDYDPELLAMSGLERDKLPDLVPANSVIGPLTPEAAAELGLPESVQVVSSVPDLHSAAVGSGAVADYEGHMAISTSAWISCHVPHKKTDLFHSMTTVPSALPGRYLVVNNHETGGACLQWMRDNVVARDDGLPGAAASGLGFEDLNRVVAGVPAGSGGVIFTPWLNGERSPAYDRTVRAGFMNLSLASTREDMLRAVYEGVAYNARWLLGAVEKMVGRRLDPIHVIGGGARSDVWCRIHADVMGRTVRQMAEPMFVNVRGAGLLAAIAIGRIGVEEVRARVRVANTYEPDPATRDVYGGLYREFRAFYGAQKDIYARLNRRRSRDRDGDGERSRP